MHTVSEVENLKLLCTQRGQERNYARAVVDRKYVYTVSSWWCWCFLLFFLVVCYCLADIFCYIDNCKISLISLMSKDFK